MCLQYLYGAKNMNMISTGAFQTEMNASNKQETVSEKFARVWEKKNAKAARAGGVSLMALSLAACGSDDATTATTTTATTTTATTTTTTTPAAKSFTLTLNEDSGSTFTGGEGDDTFSAKATQNNAGTTSYPLQTFDALDGGAGSDALDVTINTTVAPTLTNIETITAKAVAASTINMAQSSGATNLISSGSTAAMTFSNVAAIADVEIKGVAGATNTTVDYAATAVAGTADAQSLALNGNTSMGAISIGDAGAGIETLNVAVSGTNVGTSLTSGATNVAITGSGSLKLTTAVTGKIDASAATGVMTLTTAADTDTITMGSAADVLTLSDANTVTLEATVSMGDGDDSLVLTSLNGAVDLVDSKVTLDGGAGTADKITMLNILADELTDLTAANYALKGISNFEKLAISDITTTDALDFTILGINDVDFAAGQGGDAAFTIADAGKIAFGEQGSAATDTATITVKGSSGAGRNSDSITILLDSAHAGGDEDYGEMVIANVETVNIVSSTAKLTALVASDTNTAFFTIANATTVNVTGTVGLDIVDDPFDGVITSFDATGLAGALTVSFAGGTGVTYNGTAKIDTVTGSSNADSITTGEGADIITPGAGADVIVLTETTAVVDTVKVTDAVSVTSVTGFDVGTVDDIISISIGNLTTGSNDLVSTLGGTDINGAVAVGALTAAAVTATDGTVNLADATNLLVYTTGGATFAAAAGTSTVRDAAGDTSGLTAASQGVAAVWYDTDTSEAVYGIVMDTAAAGSGLTGADTHFELARVTMATTDYTLANIDASISMF
jgi:hypothetical protein